MWGSTHGVKQFADDSFADLDAMGLTVPDTVTSMYKEFKKSLETIVTSEQLSTFFPRAKQEVLDAYLPEFNSQLNAAEINTPKRLAYFFATVDVENSPLANKNNFFGVGAFDGQAKKAGTKFAKDQGWATKDLGIMGGAKIISDRWINAQPGSQSTIYSMRWNPENPGVKQYATNILWPKILIRIIAPVIRAHQRIDPLYQPALTVPKHR